MKNNKYTGLSEDHFDRIRRQYDAFLDRLNDVDKAPTKVYQPLPKKALDEIELIRTISKDLQKKKDDDVRKTQQAKEEALLKEAEKAKEEAAEEKTEDENEKKEN